jgi:hypothetical protein
MSDKFQVMEHNRSEMCALRSLNLYRHKCIVYDWPRPILVSLQTEKLVKVDIFPEIRSVCCVCILSRGHSLFIFCFVRLGFWTLDCCMGKCNMVLESGELGNGVFKQLLYNSNWDISWCLRGRRQCIGPLTRVMIRLFAIPETWDRISEHVSCLSLNDSLKIKKIKF